MKDSYQSIQHFSTMTVNLILNAALIMLSFFLFFFTSICIKRQPSLSHIRAYLKGNMWSLLGYHQVIKSVKSFEGEMYPNTTVSCGHVYYSGWFHYCPTPGFCGTLMKLSPWLIWGFDCLSLTENLTNLKHNYANSNAMQGQSSTLSLYLICE